MSATPPEHDDAAASPEVPVPPPPAPPPPPRCQDCGSIVTGRYCAECGQPAGVRVLTMRDVTHDFVHSALHLDSRVWRTLRMLVLKPGMLTTEFIAGRRQRYLPPFRLYLIISVAFFAISSLLPGESFLQVADDGESVVAPVVIGDASLARDAGQPATDRTGEPPGPAGGPDAPSVARESAGAEEPRLLAIEAPAGCEVSTGWDWLDGPLARACRSIEQDRGERLVATFLATAPKLMFLFLPLMAAVALLFYWKPRRLYAEHLVMFLHVHALVFLWLSLTSVLDALAALRLPGISLLGTLSAILMFYLPWYVFRSMRVVYGESRLRTALKFTALSALYFLLLGITMLGGMLYSAMTL